MIRHLILTGDGSHSLFVPEMGEHYHSVHGAIQESSHIFIENGFAGIRSEEISILEAGFGTGLNAFLTLLRSAADNKHVIYDAWEAFPLSVEESALLNYPVQMNADRELFQKLHEADWETEVRITPTFILQKTRNDIRNFFSAKQYDLVYFDAFGPDFQPELWETDIFRSIGGRMKTNSILVTYSAKGQVRRNLREAGFTVHKAPGPPGKREITIAIKS